MTQTREDYFKREISDLMERIIKLYRYCDVGETETTFASLNGDKSLEFKLKTRYIKERTLEELTEEYQKVAKVQKLVNPEHKIDFVVKNKPNPLK